MEDRDDRKLLRQFVETRDERAFAELVRRHIDLVYSAARRQTTDQAAAQDVTQTVFVLLIEKAGTIRAGEALAGWLLVTTRYAALNLLRAESRRRRHESEAAAMKNEQMDSSSGQWAQIQPMLDQAVSGLSTSDRDALVLRYFQNKSLADVGRAMGISEPAAQKRVNRAAHRLREFFARQGIATSAEAISSAMSAYAIGPAPLAMPAQIAHAAISTAKVVAAKSTSVGTKGAAILMASIKTKIAISIAAVLLTGIGGAAFYIVQSQPGSPITVQSPSSATRPAVPTTGPDAKIIFNAAYALEPNQTVRRILPPFLPERGNALGGTFVGPGGGRIQPNAAVFVWNGAEANRLSATTGANPRLWQILQHTAKIWPQDTDLPTTLLRRQIAGDWVIRIGASNDETMAAMSTALAYEIGAGMTIRSEPMEREVIVARGKFQYSSVIDAPKAEFRNKIVFFRGKGPEVKKLRIQSGDTELDRTFKTLGQMLNRTIIIEGELGSESHGWCVDPTCDYLDSDNVADDFAIDEVLANVTKQTSLQFAREKRTLPTWRLVKANP